MKESGISAGLDLGPIVAGVCALSRAIRAADLTELPRLVEDRLQGVWEALPTVIDAESALEDARLRVAEEGAGLLAQLLDPEQGLRLSDTPYPVEASMAHLLGQLERGGLLDTLGVWPGELSVTTA